jgi:hypothetical protein
MKLLIMEFSVTSCNFIQPKYSPQHPVLKSTQSTRMFLNATDHVSYPQNYTQHYRIVYSNFQVFRLQMRDKGESLLFDIMFNLRYFKNMNPATPEKLV